ncbi:MAG: 16S rRNA (guanine(527)-N(7))-methyltransferase RsmG [Planctomycetota bacterium]
MEDEIRDLFSSAGLELTSEDWEFFEELHAAVVEANRKMNLTRLTGRREFYSKHVLDSALPFRVEPRLRDLEEELLVADLGSGAGFPGLVLARLHSEWDVALIERTQKKAAFLEEMVETLELKRVYVVPLDARDAPGRVPVLDHGCDLVTARAVGRVADVTRSAATLLKPGGILVHYKGREPDENELAEGRRVARGIGLEQRPPLCYELPPDMGRSVVLTVNRSSDRRRTAPRRRRRAR